MKKLFAGLLTIGSISSFANCHVNIDRIVSQDIGGVDKFERILEKKGFVIVNDKDAVYSISANYSYAGPVGSAKQTIWFTLRENGEVFLSVGSEIKETIGMRYMERRSLVKFAKQLPDCN